MKGPKQTLVPAIHKSLKHDVGMFWDEKAENFKKQDEKVKVTEC